MFYLQLFAAAPALKTTSLSTKKFGTSLWYRWRNLEDAHMSIFVKRCAFDDIGKLNTCRPVGVRNKDTKQKIKWTPILRSITSSPIWFFYKKYTG